MTTLHEIPKSLKYRLHDAVENNDLQQLESLLNSPRIDVNATNEYGHTPLLLAVFNGNTAACNLLLKKTCRS